MPPTATLPRGTRACDRGEIRRVANLAGGVPLERELGVLARHPLAVVLDDDEPLSAEFDRDTDACGPGVNRVLDELFHHRRRTLDDLASRDLVGKVGWEAVDAHGEELVIGLLGYWVIEPSQCRSSSIGPISQ